MARPMPEPWLPTFAGKVDESEIDHGHVVHGMRWFQTHDVRRDEEVNALHDFRMLQDTCDGLFNQRVIKEPKFTNDPMVFPHPPASGVQPFPPNDQQYYICGIYDPQRSYLTSSAKPGHEMYTEGAAELNSTWVRLTDFNHHDGAARLFHEAGQKAHHMGRVMQGALDNGYLVEALNAVSLRPKLVKYLFSSYDMERSIYVVRLYKHGRWWYLHLDDYVPVSPPPTEHHKNHGPICCTSESFPFVLWPSLVEKAYAKLFTKRMKLVGDDPNDSGGWEAIGAGGRVEDALVMLTGGVAGRFRTKEVSADRLFLYLFEHQTDCLFVCRVNEPACELYGVRLNPYYPYAVNRAATWEGRMYVQVFCGAPNCFDGELQDLAVPYTLRQCKDYPETEADGFFWCDVNDFHLYFDTIFECHLTNTPPSEIPGMPPHRFPLYKNVPPPLPGEQTVAAHMVPRSHKNQQLYFFEQVHCHSGVINRHNAPQFDIEIQQGMHDGAEVYCSFDQYDERWLMDSPVCKRPADVLLKAYVKIGDRTSKRGQLDIWHMVCKSNWMPINHSMVGFRCRHGCRIKVVAEFPDGDTQLCEKAIFRTYCSIPHFTVAPSAMNQQHAEGELEDGMTPDAVKWSLVGAVDPQLMENPDQPIEFDPDRDGLRKPDMDVNKSWQELKQDCSVM